MVARGVVGPDDDPTALAVPGGISGEFYVLADISDFGVLNGRVLALIIPAREDLPAARGARDIKPGQTHEADLLARDLNLPALAGLRGGREAGLVRDNGGR